MLVKNDDRILCDSSRVVSDVVVRVPRLPLVVVVISKSARPLLLLLLFKTRSLSSVSEACYFAAFCCFFPQIAKRALFLTAQNFFFVFCVREKQNQNATRRRSSLLLDALKREKL